MSSKVMVSFSAFGNDFPSIALTVLHSLQFGRVCLVVQCPHVFLLCSFAVLVISAFICCRAGEVASLDLRSSRALILSNMSTGTDSVLIQCRPEGICHDAAFRMLVCKIFSLFGSLLEAVFCSFYPLISLRYRSQFAFFKLKLVRWG